MKTRRTFLASLAALAVAPFAKLFPRKPRHLFAGMDMAYRSNEPVKILFYYYAPGWKEPHPWALKRLADDRALHAERELQKLKL